LLLIPLDRIAVPGLVHCQRLMVCVCIGQRRLSAINKKWTQPKKLLYLAAVFLAEERGKIHIF
jgi:hypothetical protein